MIEWPEELVSDIARRRSAIFIGAGVSMNSTNDRGERPRDWVSFLQHLADMISDETAKSAAKKCVEEGDLLTACEVAKNTLHTENFKRILLAEFAERRFQAAPIHRDIVEIDSRIVLTSNFDKIYDTAANSILSGDVLVKSYRDNDIADIIRRPNRCIIKVHGSIDTPEDAIITRSDYAMMRNKYASFYRLLDALFLTHTFLFLGCSMNDPDLRLLLEDYSRRFGKAKPHYVVTPGDRISAPVVKVLEANMSLRILTYSVDNNHAELTASIGALRGLVNQARATLLETMNW